MAILDLGKIKLNYKGAWSNATSYEKDDVVLHNGALFISAADQAALTGKNTRIPGERGRTNAYGLEVDSSKLKKFKVTKENIVSVGLRFHFDRVPMKTLQLVRGNRYRFYTNDNNMTGVNFQLCTSVDGTAYTTGVTTYGTPGRDGWLEITVPYDAPDTLYYKQEGTNGVAGTGSIAVSDGWEGYKYWEQLSEGFKYRGSWDVETQYFAHDVITRNGVLYIAMQDSLGKSPSILDFNTSSRSGTTNDLKLRTLGYWKRLSGGNFSRQHQQAVMLMNKQPLGWPYKHNKSEDCTSYGNHQWIAADGRVWTIGNGTSGSASYPYSQPAPFAQEVPLFSQAWNESRDNNPESVSTYVKDKMTRNPEQGHLDAVTPHGERPKCIQIWHNYDSVMYLLDNGQILAVGYGTQGQAGIGDNNNRDQILPVLGLHGVKIIKIDGSMGYEASGNQRAALDSDGNLYMWGYNGYGSLGTGDTNNKHRPYQIPKEYFQNEKIIDFVVGIDFTIALTEKGNIYSWGRNNVGQLGIGDTTDRYRPAKVVVFDPAVYGGVVKMQIAGSGTSGRFYVLDGQGYLWHTGYNGYYEGLTGNTTNNTTLTRANQSPIAGNCVDFWAMGPNGYGKVWMRHANGTTYFVGHQSYYTGGVGINNSNISTPTVCPGITNLKEVYCVGSYSDSLETVWLTEDGRAYTRGYENYGYRNNYEGAQSTSESNGSDYRATRMGSLPGTKIVSIMFWSGAEGTTQFGPHLQLLTADGRVLYTGATGRANQARQYLGGAQWGSWNSGVTTFREVTKGR